MPVSILGTKTNSDINISADIYTFKKKKKKSSLEFDYQTLVT